MVPSSDINLRKAEIADLKGLIQLMQDHAAFEQLDFSYNDQEHRLQEKIFTSSEPLICFVATYREDLIGYATCIRQYATWDADYYMYLDCLYFDERFRGLGLGQKMMLLIKEEALKSGCHLMQWQPLLSILLLFAFMKNWVQILNRKNDFFGSFEDFPNP